MAGFPSTRLLDKFNREDGPLGDDWTALSGMSAAMPDVVDNAAGGGDGYKGALWNGSFGGDQECYVTVKHAANAGRFFGLLARFTGDSGYGISFDPLTGHVGVARFDEGEATILDSAAYNPGDGHGLGIQCEGSTIRGFVRVGSVWFEQFTVTDATYSAGSIGWHVFDLDEPDLFLDDFGGGAIGGPGTPPSNTARPRVGGVPETGLTVPCDPGTWTGDTPIAFDYQWQRNGTDIPGAESSDYELVEGDEGQDLRCRVLAYNAAGVGVAYSPAVSSIASTVGADDTLIAVNGSWVATRMRVAVGGEWV